MMDPYFTSAHKKYHRMSPAIEAQVNALADKLMKLPWDERATWKRESYNRPTSFVERQARKRIEFLGAVKKRAIKQARQKRMAESFRENGVAVFSGYNIGAR
jgi:hypothetical protein